MREGEGERKRGEKRLRKGIPVWQKESHMQHIHVCGDERRMKSYSLRSHY